MPEILKLINGAQEEVYNHELHLIDYNDATPRLTYHHAVRHFENEELVVATVDKKLVGACIQAEFEIYSTVFVYLKIFGISNSSTRSS